MSLKKLFSFDSVEVRRLRPQARYLEGRGSYPETGYMQEEFVTNEYFHPDELRRHEEVIYRRPEGSMERDRLPLTTLEALVQIKTKKLAHIA